LPHSRPYFRVRSPENKKGFKECGFAATAVANDNVETLEAVNDQMAEAAEVFDFE
jgi:hypothetical protein